MADGEILRFPALQKSVNQFIEDQKNKQTLSKARCDVGLLSEFLKSKQENRKIEEIQSQELNDFRSEFILTVIVHSNCFYSSTELEAHQASSRLIQWGQPDSCTISETIFCQSFFIDSTIRCFTGHVFIVDSIESVLYFIFDQFFVNILTHNICRAQRMMYFLWHLVWAGPCFLNSLVIFSK